MAFSEVFQLDEARGRPLGRGGGEGHLAAEVAAVWVERHQPKDDHCKFLSYHFFLVKVHFILYHVIRNTKRIEKHL